LIRGFLLVFAAAFTMLVAPVWAQQPAKLPVVGMRIAHAATNDPIFEY
jgi:hypothetical protein